MTVLALPRRLLEDTFGQLRRCGRNGKECVAYWLGPADVDSLVDEVVHPAHAARGGGYQIDDRWLTQFWFDLARRRKSVRVQIHTHPKEASHSTTDDAWALIHTPGFLSLVIPNFAMGRVGLMGAHLVERVEGGWREADPLVRLAVIP